MSTRTMISAKMKGKVYAIYCHHDGYPEHIAPLLLNTYNTQEKIEELILLGYTSAIYEAIEKCIPYMSYEGAKWEDNAPDITDEWERHDFFWEYFWNGQQWLYCESDSGLKPLSTWSKAEGESEGIVCDRCGRVMNTRWEIAGIPGDGGNCTECGDNLCAECGGKWGENGECEYCSMSLEDLEYALPITIQREEKKQMPCSDCKRNCKETVSYEQRIYRSDDFFNNRKTRTYEIAYVRQYSRGTLFRTQRHHSFRAALMEAHITLDKMGLNPKEKKNAD